MKMKKTNFVAVSLIIACLCLAWLIVEFTSSKAIAQGVSLNGRARSGTFVLGEPVGVEFAFVNETETSVKIPGGGVEIGSLKIYIAPKDQPYKEYIGYGWGLKLGRALELKPGESHKYKEAVILWNGKPNVTGLSENNVKRIAAERITTDYAFPEPGVYFIKGVSYFGENAAKIESEPIEIVITEPVGDDLKVWNQIQKNQEIALLMQSGEFNTGKEEEKAKLVREIEQILETYPNSVYSGYLKPNLEKFKVSEGRRRDFTEKINSTKQP